MYRPPTDPRQIPHGLRIPESTANREDLDLILKQSMKIPYIKAFPHAHNVHYPEDDHLLGFLHMLPEFQQPSRHY